MSRLRAVDVFAGIVAAVCALELPAVMLIRRSLGALFFDPDRPHTWLDLWFRPGYAVVACGLPAMVLVVAVARRAPPTVLLVLAGLGTLAALHVVVHTYVAVVTLY